MQGGILVDDPEEEHAAMTLSQMPSVDLQVLALRLAGAHSPARALVWLIAATQGLGTAAP